MKAIDNWNFVQAAGESRQQLPAGGYVCVITGVENVEPKEYLRIEYDIFEGPYEKHGQYCLERNGWTPLRFIRSYKGKAVGMFKGFISCVEKCNPGFVWRWDERELTGKHIGLVLGEEEYRRNDGSIGTRIAVARVCTCDDILNKNFTVPEKKTLTVTEEPPAWLPNSAPAADLPEDL